MNSNSISIDGTSMDAIEQALNEKYKGRRISTRHYSQHGEMMLMLIEKYYMRSSSDYGGVIFVESKGENRYSIEAWSLGGSVSRDTLKSDLGSQKHFVKEMISAIQPAATDQKENKENGRVKERRFKKER